MISAPWGPWCRCWMPKPQRTSWSAMLWTRLDDGGGGDCTWSSDCYHDLTVIIWFSCQSNLSWNQKKPLSSLVPYTSIHTYIYIYIHNILSNSPSVAGDAPNQLVFQWEPLPGFLLSTGLWLGNSGDTIATATNEWWNRVAYIWPDGTRWNQMDVQFERQHEIRFAK